MTIDNRTEYKLTEQDKDRLCQAFNGKLRSFTNHIIIETHNPKGEYLVINADGYAFTYFYDMQIAMDTED